MTRSGGASPLLVILAVIAVAGLLWWLNRASADLEQQAAPVLADSTEAAPVDLDAAGLATSPGESVGRTGWLRSVDVDQRLGRGALAVALDSTHMYPVLLSSDIISRGSEVYANDRVSVFGRVFTLNDSIRSEWVTQGAVDQANAEAIPRTSSFLLADSLSVGS